MTILQLLTAAMAKFLFLCSSWFLATFFLLFLCENMTIVSVHYQEFLKELIIRTALSITAGFSLNFCTGIKTLLALKL